MKTDIRPKRKPRSPHERLLMLTTIRGHNECWTWNGSKSKDGYGQFILSAAGERKGGKRVRVAPYRYMWEIYNGKPFPKGLEPDHTCNNRSCVNPRHIEPVTHSENQRRSYARGRKRPGRDYKVRVRPTHCPRGHEYTPENLRINNQGGMVCRACDSLSGKRQRLRRIGVLVTVDELFAETQKQRAEDPG